MKFYQNLQTKTFAKDVYFEKEWPYPILMHLEGKEAKNYSFVILLAWT